MSIAEKKCKETQTEGSLGLRQVEYTLNKNYTVIRTWFNAQSIVQSASWD